MFELFSIRSFRKYKSASIHFAKPYNEKYRKEFEQEIGKENYIQWVLEFDVIPCPMNPFQSGKFFCIFQV